MELCISMAGALCLWLGVMEIMRRSGLAAGLSRLLRPVLRRLYPDFAQNGPVMDSVSANVSANLLGLGNAATPLGLEAARRMGGEISGSGVGQPVHAGGVQHRLYPAAAYHGGQYTLRSGQCCSL